MVSYAILNSSWWAGGCGWGWGAAGMDLIAFKTRSLTPPPPSFYLLVPTCISTSSVMLCGLEYFIAIYKISKIVQAFWLVKNLWFVVPVNSFIKAIDHTLYRFTGMITHAGCWENTRIACKSLAFGFWFTSFSHVLPTSCVGYHAGKSIETVVSSLNKQSDPDKLTLNYL